jgi:hypothetical protein
MRNACKTLVGKPEGKRPWALLSKRKTESVLAKKEIIKS